MSTGIENFIAGPPVDTPVGQIAPMKESDLRRLVRERLADGQWWVILLIGANARAAIAQVEMLCYSGRKKNSRFELVSGFQSGLVVAFADRRLMGATRFGSILGGDNPGAMAEQLRQTKGLVCIAPDERLSSQTIAVFRLWLDSANAPGEFWKN